MKLASCFVISMTFALGANVLAADEFKSAKTTFGVETIQTYFDVYQEGIQDMSEGMDNYVAFVHAARFCLETKKTLTGSTEFVNGEPRYTSDSQGCKTIRDSNKIAMIKHFATLNRIRNLETASQIFELEIEPAADELVARNDQRQILRRTYAQISRPIFVEKRSKNSTIKGAIIGKDSAKVANSTNAAEGNTEIKPKKRMLPIHSFQIDERTKKNFLLPKEIHLDYIDTNATPLSERVQDLLVNSGLNEGDLTRDASSVEAVRRLVLKFAPRIVPY